MTVNRRDFLKHCAALAAYGALGKAFFPLKLSGAIPENKRSDKKSRKAKSVIEIWVWGGPSQLETFDPKPNAPKDYNGGYKAIPTNIPGIEISEFWPQMAKIADKYSIIRSMTHPHRGHETATYLMQTGRNPGGGKVFPAIGAVIAMFKRNEYKGDIPPYVILTIPKGRFSEVGFLGEEYNPLVTGGNPNAAQFIVEEFKGPAEFRIDITEIVNNALAQGHGVLKIRFRDLEAENSRNIEKKVSAITLSKVKWSIPFLLFANAKKLLRSVPSHLTIK